MKLGNAEQVRPAEQDLSLDEKAPWEKEEYAPYDVVWYGMGRGTAEFHSAMQAGNEMAVYRSYEDFMANLPQGCTWCDVRPATLDTAKRVAAEHGCVAVALYDHEGNEIRRWPV